MKRAPSRYRIVLLAAAVALALAGTHCAQDTSRLTPEQEARFKEEGVLRRADNIVFHYTRGYGHRREETRENRLASVVVTPRSVLIQKNAKVGLEITSASRRFYDVHRRGTRVLVHAGSGGSTEIWSFEPPTDAEGWTRDIRSVIRGSRD